MLKIIKRPIIFLQLLGLVMLAFMGQGDNDTENDEEDPLAELIDLESSLATENPQAGGSIRDKFDPSPIVRRNKKGNDISKFLGKKKN